MPDDGRNRDSFDETLRALLADHHYDWRGFRKKRRGVRSRLTNRLSELGLGGLTEYRDYLRMNPHELRRLHELLSITISRFFRDREEWSRLEDRFPNVARLAVAAGRDGLRGEVSAWSFGCSCGEEPYTLRIAWERWSRNAAEAMPLHIFATDISAPCLERARRGIYTASSVRGLPTDALADHFDVMTDGTWEIDPGIRSTVEFRRHDFLSDAWPNETFDLVLCRNIVFTYLADPVRARVAERLVKRLRPGGFLMVGSNDRFDDLSWELQREGACFWRRPGGGGA